MSNFSLDIKYGEFREMLKWDILNPLKFMKE